jgi:hypothetical protein
MQYPTVPKPTLYPYDIPAKQALHSYDEFKNDEPPTMRFIVICSN